MKNSTEANNIATFTNDQLINELTKRGFIPHMLYTTETVTNILNDINNFSSDEDLILLTEEHKKDILNDALDSLIFDNMVEDTIQFLIENNYSNNNNN